MNFKTLKCKIFSDSESEFEEEDFTVGRLHIDLDSVSSFRMSDDKKCTVIYSGGFSYELLISVSEFSRLKGLNNEMFPRNEGFILMFGKN